MYFQFEFTQKTGNYCISYKFRTKNHIVSPFFFIQEFLFGQSIKPYCFSEFASAKSSISTLIIELTKFSNTFSCFIGKAIRVWKKSDSWIFSVFWAVFWEKWLFFGERKKITDEKQSFFSGKTKSFYHKDEVLVVLKLRSDFQERRFNFVKGRFIIGKILFLSSQRQKTLIDNTLPSLQILPILTPLCAYSILSQSMKLTKLKTLNLELLLRKSKF